MAPLMLYGTWMLAAWTFAADASTPAASPRIRASFRMDIPSQASNGISCNLCAVVSSTEDQGFTGSGAGRIRKVLTVEVKLFSLGNSFFPRGSACLGPDTLSAIDRRQMRGPVPSSVRLTHPDPSG